MTTNDLAGYRAVQRRPVSTDYRGYQVYGMNMPTSGGATLLLMLNMLEGVDLGNQPWGSADWAHWMANVQNLAFADRNAYLGDPDWSDIPTQRLLDSGYAAERRSLIPTLAALLHPVESVHPPLLPPTSSLFIKE